MLRPVQLNFGCPRMESVQPWWALASVLNHSHIDLFFPILSQNFTYCGLMQMQLSPFSDAAAVTQQGSKAPCYVVSWPTSLDNVSTGKPTVLKHHIYVWQGSLVLQRSWGWTIILSDQFQKSTQRLISYTEPEAGRPYPRVPPASSALLRIYWAPWLEVSWERHSISSFPKGLNILPGCGLYQPQLFRPAI